MAQIGASGEWTDAEERKLARQWTYIQQYGDAKDEVIQEIRQRV